MSNPITRKLAAMKRATIAPAQPFTEAQLHVLRRLVTAIVDERLRGIKLTASQGRRGGCG
jgi:hypothetical protein